MNWKKLCTAVMLVAGFLFFASASNAQVTPQFVGVGSSGIFPSMGIAAINGDPITKSGPICGTRFWSAKTASQLAWGQDSRGGTIPLEFGNIWVAWDSDTAPTVVCAFLSVDSIVGLRLFYGTGSSGNGTVVLAPAAKTTAGANAVNFVSDTATAGLPTLVYQSLCGTGATCSGTHFNIVFSDIRPEDGQFAYGRAACNRANVFDVSCFGYGPAGGVGTAIQSSYSQTSAQVVAFSISGSDPISHLGVPSSFTVPVGAEPVLVFYSTADHGTGGLGALLPTNITHQTAASIWSGLFGITDQFAGVQSGAGVNLHVVEREPVSGTYNTFEWQMIHTRDAQGGSYSQEFGFGPTTPSTCGFTPPATATYVPPPPADQCANPANVYGTQGSSFGGIRTRAIGTGEMVAAVNSTNNPDSIGYAFWSLGTFGGKTNIKYVTVDGTDPLYPNYSTNAGSLPTCTGFFNTNTFSCTGNLPTFDNVKNGAYRVFNVMRAAYYQSYTPPTTGPSITTLIQAAQDQAAPGATQTVPDIVPSQYCANQACTSFTDGLPVFRSHYTINGVDANNGTNASFCAGDQTPPCIEEGGDMAGVVFYDRQDQVFFSLTGSELLTWIQ